jgi:peptidoglycan/LPS O-acetylase OafA/YrhL
VNAPSVVRKNQEIEVLRGVAVLLATTAHLPILLPYHEKAFATFYLTHISPASGVDLFFAISGFVVSKAFLEFFDRLSKVGRFGLAFRVFWLRRAFRLLPTSWLWVLVGLVLSIVFNSTGQFGTPWDNLRSGLVVLTMCGNILNQFGRLLYPNDVYWSLALEEQFYLAFPFFLLLVSAPWRHRVLLSLIGIQFLLDRTFNIIWTDPVVAFLWAIRLDAIMWGVVIFLFSRTAFYRRLEPTFLTSFPIVRSIIALVPIYLLVAIPAKLPHAQVMMGLVALSAAASVLLASYDRGYANPLPRLSGFLSWVGARSYAMYVIHVTAFRLSLEAWSRYAAQRGYPLSSDDTVPMLITAAVLWFGLSELNYRFVEMPMRDKGKRIAERHLALAATTPA